jgi:hypothetical protein
LPANPPFVAALKAFGPMFLTFLAGAGVGAAVTRSTSAPTVVYVQPSAQSPSTPLAPSAESLAPAVDTSAPDEVVGPSAPPPKRVVAPDASSSSSRSALNAERALLDRGRMAFARGDAAACLGLLDEHRARYPRGVLGEERDALAIRALVALGRTSEAHTLASKFEQSYPTSLMLPAVKAALGESSSAN